MAKKKKAKKTKEKRQPQIMSFTGSTGTGKSTLCKTFADKYLNNRRKLVVTYTNKHKIWQPIKKIKATPEDLQFESGWRHILYGKEGKDTLPMIVEHFRDGVVVLDDCKMYIKSDWEHTPGLKDLTVDHRPMGLDLMFVAHAPRQIPPNVWPFLHWAFIMRSPTVIKQSEVNVDELEKFQQLQKIVNAEYKRRLRAGQSKYGIYKCLML